jgi:Ca-activated chloride channel family protein
MAEFHFLRPYWLLALLLLAWLGWLLSRSRAGPGAWQQVCDAHLLPYLLVTRPDGASRLPLGLLGLGWLLAVLALAGPTWSKQPQPILQTRHARVIVMDLSRSMLAPDVKPSRLVRARFKVADILQRSREGQTGLVIFAGEAFVVVPLTQDADTIAAVLPVLEPALMPVQGSRTDLGLHKAGELLRQAGFHSGEILLVTDGSNGQLALDAARELRSQGLRISVLAVGTEQGAPLPLAGGGFLRDASGAIVVPRMQAAELRELADAGGGCYAALSADNSDLDQLLADDSAAWGKEVQHSEQETAGWREEGPWLVVLLMPLAALAFRRGWLLLLVVLVPPPCQASGWADLWQRRDQQATQALQQGDFERAAQLGDPMQRGIAEYRQGRYAQAAAAFAQATGADAHYNRGNALAQLGRYREALAAYDAALAAEPAMEDARFNRVVVEALLRQQASSAPATQQQPGKENRADAQPDPARSSQQTDPPIDNPSAAGQPSPGQGPTSAQSAGAGLQTAAAGSHPGEQGKSVGQQEAVAAEGNDSTLQQGLAETQDDLRRHEEQQLLERWLRRIPDDPGGLWRRKFQYQYQLGGGRAHADHEQSW